MQDKWPLTRALHRDFAYADFTDADLTDANLTRADFTDAVLIRANFRGATGLTTEQRANFKARGAIVDD